MRELKFNSRCEDDTRRLGMALAKSLTPGLVILLNGELGAGKTVLVRGVGEALGIKGVRSPSFTLINEYKAKNFLLAHADLYRLEDEAGVDALGLDEYADAPDAVLIVEWPDRWRDRPTDGVLNINFNISEDYSSREILLSASGERAAGVLASLAGELELATC